eukprot:UN24136
MVVRSQLKSLYSDFCILIAGFLTRFRKFRNDCIYQCFIKFLDLRFRTQAMYFLLCFFVDDVIENIIGSYLMIVFLNTNFSTILE